MPNLDLLEEVIEAFEDIKKKIEDTKDNELREDFIAYLQNSVISETPENFYKDEAQQDGMMFEIIKTLKKKIPQDGLDPQENIVTDVDDYETSITVHVDAFLYSDDDIDDLVEEGKFSRNYCSKCLSHETKPLTLISHSMSLNQIKYIFSQQFLGNLKNKTVLDVGSRLGNMLYGGFLYGKNLKKLTGIEFSKFFYDCQLDVVSKFGFSNKIELVHDDILNQGDLLQNSNIVILNNVFEFFQEKEEQVKLWDFLFQNILKKDTLVVAVPSIQASLDKLGINSKTSRQYINDINQSFVKLNNTSNREEYSELKSLEEYEMEELEDIHLYRKK